MPGLRIELSPPEAVERFRDVAHALLEWEKGELSDELRQRLASKARDLGVHPLDRDAVLAEVTALPAIQALRRLSRGDIEQLAERARQGDATALARLRQEAKRGHATAQNNLGLMYKEGRGVPQDDGEAVKWYRLAAEQGDATAQNNLGLMYFCGHGVPKDDNEAVKWYRLAAEQGNASAKAALDRMLKNLGPPSRQETKPVTKPAFSQLSGETIEQLFNHAREGDAASLDKIRQAAERGDINAQYKLGWMYQQGRGVQRDDREAVKWYRLAAKQRYAAAQKSLDLMYRENPWLDVSRRSKPPTR